MEKTLKEIIRVLEHTRGIKAYALIGGLAVGGWIAPRATKDIDILVDLSITNRSAIEEILKKLLNSGFKGGLEIGGPEDDIKFCIKAVSSGKIPVDIIFASRKWEAEIAEEGVAVRVLEGISIPLAKPEGLIALKLRAGGFQDVADAARLLMEADYDLQILRKLTKRARVDKRLERMLEKLGLT
ncbi:MAG: nucleotidyl transferase AbiEii/AbiGii toxin family protein [Deltaproteobacteria bacterium]|nr:nucleotidyl transferase AbiEii/AbiGii toxin family protein [Deltaproteobacteria bacterium]